MNTEQESVDSFDEPFSVGDWWVDARANEVRRSGETTKLEPKVMLVLCVLATRPGGVVTREELEARAWPGVIVTNDAVTGSMIKLRRALGDDARRPRYIETLPKSGYRLLARVDREPPAVLASSTSIPSQGWRRTGIVATLLAVFAAVLWVVLAQDEAPTPNRVMESADIEGKPGIAVLPFDNLGSAPENDYFADGITLDLITDLSKLSGLRVVARNSSFAYKDSAEDERQISRDLGVDYLLKGSVQRSGGRIRINVHLTDGSNRGNLWTERYDRRLDDIFEIQDEIAADIVSALKLRISPADRSRLIGNHSGNMQAYDEFLRGLDHFGRRSIQDTLLARQHFERAIGIDSGFARAYAGLALVYTSDTLNGWDMTAHNALDQAEELTEQARRLDPSVPQIYFVVGLIELFRRNFDAAIRNAEHAISIKPSYADAYALLAWIQHFAGYPDEGLDSMRKAVRLNPRVPSVYQFVRGALHYSNQDFEQASADFEAAVEVNPNYQLLRIWLAATYAAVGRIDEAEWEGREILALDPEFSTSRVERALPIVNPLYRERLVNDLRRAGLPD